ncbi:MAG: hypothetical protein JW751_30460 [Polyangiaceae bacterium]|nr:hypothetical protein [Polyangiaceae bacterium]
MALALAAPSTACGPEFENAEGTESSCADDLAACGSAQTCWPNLEGNAFVCLLSPAEGFEGHSCRIVAGDAECAHGLFCYAPGGNDGFCSPRCDPNATETTCTNTQCSRLSVGDIGVIGVCPR